MRSIGDVSKILGICINSVTIGLPGFFYSSECLFLNNSVNFDNCLRINGGHFLRTSKKM